MRFGWFAYLVPFIFVFSPELLMEGDASSIILTTIAAFVGVWLISVAIIGFLVREINPLLRVLFLVAGLAFLVPGNAVNLGIPNDVLGIFLGAALIANEYFRRRRAVNAETQIKI